MRELSLSTLGRTLPMSFPYESFICQNVDGHKICPKKHLGRDSYGGVASCFPTASYQRKYLSKDPWAGFNAVV